MPGVPDVYQGSELWEQSLVDPDNRRPVDFDLRAAAARRRRPRPTSAAAKLLVTATALRLRRDRPELFTSYAAGRRPAARPPSTSLAFDRGGAVTVATRLPVGLAAARRLGRHDARPARRAGGATALTGRRGRRPARRPARPRSRWRCWCGRTHDAPPAAPFDVWAPRAARLRLSVGDETVEMQQDRRRLVDAVGARARPGERRVDYGYLIDDADTPRPDPRSRRQPAGVHQRSRTHDPTAYAWTDEHVDRRQLAGVGDLRAARRHLHARGHPRRRARPSSTTCARIGVDFVELMPVNAFNGTHNWGYDGVLWFAVARGVRRPGRLPALRRRLPRRRPRRRSRTSSTTTSGPSGNYLPLFGPYLKPGPQHLGRPGQPRRRGLRRGAPLHPRQRADVARATTTSTGCGSTPCTRSTTRSEAHLLEEMAIEVAALSAHQRPAADADRRVRPQRPAADHAARGRRLRARRAVERRLPPRRARRADRRDRRLLRRLRAARGAGQGVRARLLPRRHLLVVPRARPRRPDRHRGHADLAARRVQPEPRPDRQPRRRRPDHRGARRRPARLRGAADAVRPVHPDALPGRGVGGLDAVPVLHLPPRARARARRRPRAGSRSSSRWAGTPPSCPTRRTRRPSSARSSTGPRPSHGRQARGCWRRLPPAGRRCAASSPS